MTIQSEIIKTFHGSSQDNVMSITFMAQPIIIELTRVHQRQDEKEIERKTNKRIDCVRTDGPYRITLLNMKEKM